MGQRIRALSPAGSRVWPLLLVLGLGSACAADRALTFPLAAGAPPDPFATLTPFPVPLPISAIGAPQGPAPRLGPQTRLSSLWPPPTKDPRPKRGAVKVTVQPPLDGNPHGAIAFVFNQPMVPSTAVGRPADKARLKVTPATPGRLEWLTTSTLVFTPERRFRYATAYRAILAPGLVSRWNRHLRGAQRVGFSTASPVLVEVWPEPGTQALSRRPIFRLRFNQAVKVAAVLARLRLEGPTSPALEVLPARRTLTPTPATPSQVVLRFRPVEALRESSAYNLFLDPGLPGQEGPLTTAEGFHLPFTIAGPLRLVAASCEPAPCRPGSRVRLRLHGTADAFAPCARLSIAPLPAELRCQPDRQSLRVAARFGASTSYRFSLDPPITEARPTTAPAAALDLTFAARTKPPGLRPDRALLATPAWAPRLRPLDNPGARLRLASVGPALVDPLLRAISDPGTAAPFELIGGRVHQLGPRSSPAPKAVPKPVAPKAARATGLLLLGIDTAVAPKAQANDPLDVERRAALLQLTALSLVVRYGWSGGVALVTNWRDGKALDGIPLTLRDRGGRILWQGVTDLSGLARFPGRRQLRRRGPFTLWAAQGADRSLVVLDGGSEDDVVVRGYWPSEKPPGLEELVGGVWTDRARYRPGERLRLFGLLRSATRLPRGSIGRLPARYRRLSYRVIGPAGVELVAGTAPIHPVGLWSSSLELPATTARGRYTIRVHLADPTRGHERRLTAHFEVAPRAPGLRLQVRPSGGDATAQLGRPYPLRVRVSDSSGRPLTGGVLRWQLYRRAEAPRPPGCADFQFGPVRGAGKGYQRSGTPAAAHRAPGRWEAAEATWVAAGERPLDARGTQHLAPLLEGTGRRGDQAIFQLQLEVSTADGRLIRHHLTLPAARVGLRLGLRAGARWVAPNQDLPVTILAVDGQGRPRTGAPVVITARRVNAAAEAPPAARCERSLALGIGECHLRLPTPGRYLVRAAAERPVDRAADDVLPLSPTAIMVEVIGAAAAPKPRRLELLPAHGRFGPGERVHLLIRSPVVPATALLTLERDGIAWARALPLKGAETLVELPVSPRLSGADLWVGASLAPPHDDAGHDAAKLSARVRLRHDAHSRRHLTLGLRGPPRQASPGAVIPLRIRVRANRHPTRAAIMVYLSPASTPHPDPARQLRLPYGPGVGLRATWAHQLRRIEGRGTTAAPPPHNPFGTPPRSATSVNDNGQDLPGEPGDQVTTGIFFRGPLLTNATGQLSLPVTLPRRPGRYRLVVLAADTLLPALVGSASQLIQVAPRLSLSLKTPPQLRSGDRVRLLASLGNSQDHPLRVSLHSRALGAPVKPAHTQLSLRPRQRTTVPLLLEAGPAGLVRLQLAARSWRPNRQGRRPPRRLQALERQLTIRQPGEQRGWLRLGSFRGSATIAAPPQARRDARLQLSLSNSPLVAALPALRWLLLRQPHTLAGTAAQLLALALAEDWRRRGLLVGLPEVASAHLLCRRAVALLAGLRLRGGRFRAAAAGPPANVPTIGLALRALSRAAQAGCRAPAALASVTAQYLKTIVNAPHRESEERAAALAALLAAKRAPPRPWPRLAWDAAMDPLVAARLLSTASASGIRRTKLIRSAARGLAVLNPAGGRALRGATLEIMIHRLAAVSTSDLPSATRALLDAARRGRWGDARLTILALIALGQSDRRLAASRGAPQLQAWLSGHPWGQARLTATRPGILTLPPRARPANSGTPSTSNPTAFPLVIKAPATALTWFALRVHGSGRGTTDSWRPASIALRIRASGLPKGTATPANGPLSLRPGQVAEARVTLVAHAALPAATLEIPVPAGCRLLDSGHPGWRRPPRSIVPRPRYPALPLNDASARATALRLQLPALVPGIYEHRFLVAAREIGGQFRCEPAVLRSADDDRILGRAQRCRPLTVGP